jgi:hypothetical protein
MTHDDMPNHDSAMHAYVDLSRIHITQKTKFTPAPPRAPVTAPQSTALTHARARNATQLSTVAAHALLKAEADTASVVNATLAAPARMPSAAQLGSVSAARAPKPAPRARQKAAHLDIAQVLPCVHAATLRTAQHASDSVAHLH